MGAYNSIKRTYYTIANGMINHRDKEGNVTSFTGIDGVLKDIVLRRGKVNGTEKMFTDFVLEDAGEQLIVSAGLHDGVSNSILSCLANIDDFVGKLSLETWSRTADDGRTFTNITVKMNGERVKWIALPGKEDYQLPTGEKVKSTKTRDDFVDKLIAQIQAKLRGEVKADAAEGLVIDDDIPAAEPEYKPNIEG